MATVSIMYVRQNVPVSVLLALVSDISEHFFKDFTSTESCPSEEFERQFHWTESEKLLTNAYVRVYRAHIG